MYIHVTVAAPMPRLSRLVVALSLAVVACGQPATEFAQTTFVEPDETTTTGGGSTTIRPPDLGSASASDSAGESATGATTGATTDDPIRLDLGIQPDLGTPPDCPGPGPDLLYTHIWVANSAEGTVSRIDTRTRTEKARYRTSGGINDNPSRTSVNLEGDVAVVNRLGGVTKIIADPARCPDLNNDGEVQTSHGPGNVLPWGKDECVAWWTPLPPRSRPAAWTAGELVGEGCEAHYEGIELWTSAPVGDDVVVFRLASSTGDITAQITIPELGTAGLYGIYGGAVDSNGDFWGVVYNAGPLVHVHRDDMSYELLPLPQPSAYGMTVDNQGRPWIGGFDGVLQRYDPALMSWQSVDTGLDSLLRGMTQHAEGELWIAALNPSGVLRVDSETATVQAFYSDLPGIDKPTGTSIDYDGYIWLVDQVAEGAFVLNPEDGQFEAFVGGLKGPYTYSDMTGWALGNVLDPHG